MRGPGAMLAIELAGGLAAAESTIAGLGLFTHAVSLTHRPVAPEARPGAGILRLSIGLENVEDLWLDLDRALSMAHGAGSSAAGIRVDGASVGAGAR